MKMFLYFMTPVLLINTAMAQNTLVYKDKTRPVEERISDLVSRMTLDEKVLQLNQYTAGENTNINNIGEETMHIPNEIGSLIYFGSDPVYRNEIQRKAMEESRLGIPILFGFDVIHGFRSVYPISLGAACSWNPDLGTLTEILKERWQHDGFVVSDWDAILQLIAQGVAADRKEAGLKAFTAGIEMGMFDKIYADHIKELVEEGSIPMSAIDDAVSRVLRVKFRLGLFDQPLKKTGKPIVLILSSGRPLELVRIEPLADAVLTIWQPGIAGGSALAGILSGRINPSGKLAITFPLTTGQIPIYYNSRQHARPFSHHGLYQDISSEPLYWFGHGLSYTTFSYGEIKLSATKIMKNERLIAEVEVENTGERSGKETVHWYIADPVSSISRPMRELKYFEKKEIAPSGKAKFTFDIDPMRDLSYKNEKGDRLLEAGTFFVIVNDQRLSFEVIE